MKGAGRISTAGTLDTPVLCAALLLLAGAARGGKDETTTTEYDAMTGATAEAERHLIVFVGDSITQGGDWRRLLGRNDVVNRGVSGDTTSDILGRLEGVADAAATHYFVMAGVNDLARGVEPAAIAANVRTIVERLRAASPDAAVFLQSVLPIDDRDRCFRFDNARVQAVNEKLRKLADPEAAVTFVDLYGAFLDEEEKLAPGYTYDGLHLLPAGYAVWAEQIRPRMP